MKNSTIDHPNKVKNKIQIMIQNQLFQPQHQFDNEFAQIVQD
jgi:hypothetical protein